MGSKQKTPVAVSLLSPGQQAMHAALRDFYSGQLSGPGRATTQLGQIASQGDSSSQVGGEASGLQKMLEDLTLHAYTGEDPSSFGTNRSQVLGRAQGDIAAGAKFAAARGLPGIFDLQTKGLTLQQGLSFLPTGEAARFATAPSIHALQPQTNPNLAIASSLLKGAGGLAGYYYGGQSPNYGTGGALLEGLGGGANADTFDLTAGSSPADFAGMDSAGFY